MQEQNILWVSGLFMQAGQSISLPTPISKTKNGIVLTFSFFENGVAQDYAFHHFFIPKAFVAKHDGAGHQFNCFWNGWSNKYLYIKDSAINGGSTNTAQNNRFVLRKVIAV